MLPSTSQQWVPAHFTCPLQAWQSINDTHPFHPHWISWAGHMSCVRSSQACSIVNITVLQKIFLNKATYNCSFVNLRPMFAIFGTLANNNSRQATWCRTLATLPPSGDIWHLPSIPVTIYIINMSITHTRIFDRNLDKINHCKNAGLPTCQQIPPHLHILMSSYCHSFPGTTCIFQYGRVWRIVQFSNE